MAQQPEVYLAWRGVFLAALALIVIVTFLVALVWALFRSRRPGLVVATLFGLAVLVGIPVLMIGVYLIRARASHEFTAAVFVEPLSAADELVDASPTPPVESAGQARVPEWVDREPQRRQDGAVVRTLTGRRYATAQESIDDALRQAAEEARTYLQQAAPRPVRWDVPVAFVQDELVRDQFVAEVDWEAEGVDSPPFAEPMYQAHLLVEFTPRKRDMLLQMWQENVLGERVSWLVAGSGFLLVLLTTLAVYLRLDEATRGYYSGRLKLAAVAVVGVTGAVLISVLA